MTVRDEDGFTLIETLVAFAIAAILLTAYQQLAGGAQRATGHERDRELAALTGASLIESLVSTPEALTGRSGTLDRGITWRLDLKALAVAADPGKPVPYRVLYEAFDARRKRLVTLDTIVVGRGAR